MPLFITSINSNGAMAYILSIMVYEIMINIYLLGGNKHQPLSGIGNLMIVFV